MSHRTIVLLWIVGIWPVLSSSAYAQMLPTPTICKTYFVTNAKDAPQEVIAAFEDMRPGPDAESDAHQLFDNAAIRKCANPSAAKPWYAALLTPRKIVGVCHFKEYDITDLFTAKGAYAPKLARKNVWFTEPSIEMLVTKEPCPPQDGRDYILTRGISPGLFREIATFWSKFTSSKTAFEEGLSQLSNDEWTRKSEGELRKNIEPKIGHAPSIHSVSVALYMIATTDFLYEINVPINDFESWMIGIELTEQGFKIVRIGKIVV